MISIPPSNRRRGTCFDWPLFNLLKVKSMSFFRESSLVHIITNLEQIRIFLLEKRLILKANQSFLIMKNRAPAQELILDYC